MKGLKVTEGSKFEEIFKHEEFGEVRTIIGEDGEPWFMLADVCRVLEIKNSSDAKSRLNNPYLVTTDIGVQTGIKKDGTPAMQTVKATFVNEANLYKLVFQSRKPQAERFADWVTSEVLPSIRKHGVYITEELLADKEKLEKAIEDFTEENAKLKNKLKKVEPYVTFTGIVA